MVKVTQKKSNEKHKAIPFLEVEDGQSVINKSNDQSNNSTTKSINHIYFALHCPRRP